MQYTFTNKFIVYVDITITNKFIVYVDIIVKFF